MPHPKDQEGLDIHDLKIKNTTLLDKWLFNFFLLKMRFGRTSLNENTLPRKHYYRLHGNLVIHTSRPVSWLQSISFALGLF
jgi:hypothetical protein